jgi:hypothetical protein
MMIIRAASGSLGATEVVESVIISARTNGSLQGMWSAFAKVRRHAMKVWIRSRSQAADTACDLFLCPARNTALLRKR